jgi:hypothetical protein
MDDARTSRRVEDGYAFCFAGLTARCLIVDISMPHSQQAGYDRQVCKVPSDSFLKQLAEDIKKITPTQVWLVLAC